MGLAIGPTIGSLVFEQVGYLFTFVIFGIFVLFGGILAWFMLPEHLNNAPVLKLHRQDSSESIPNSITQRKNSNDSKNIRLLRQDSGRLLEDLNAQ